MTFWQKIKHNQQGFTFIEIILYIAIVAIMMNSLIPFAWNVIEGGAKSSVQQEVFSQARYISERLKAEIRNSIGINTGTSNFGVNIATAGGQLSLQDIAPNDPTIIDVSNGIVRIKQGAGTVISLNSANTSVSNLTFTNYSSADNKSKHIGFTLTIIAKYAGAGTRQEYQATTTLESSAEVRNNSN